MRKVIHSYRIAPFYFLLLSLLFISCTQNKTSENIPKAVKGIIDLRQTDLSQQIIPLKGEWAFYWKQLLTPKDTPVYNSNFVHFPQLWEKTYINGRALNSEGYASYSLTVLLPKHNKSLALSVPDTYSSYRLFLNGVEFCNNGSPDTTEKTTVSKWIEKTVQINNSDDTLQLLLQVANFWHSKGGPYKDIIIGDKENLFLEKEKDSAFDLLLTGAMLMGGLFFFGLFLFGKHDKAMLYFALFSIVYSYRIAGSRSYVLHTIYPDFPWNIAIHLEYITLFISVAFFILYTKHLYPEDINKKIIQSCVGVCLALSGIVIVFPPFIFTQTINPFLILMFAITFYFFYIYWKAYQKKRLAAGYAIISTAVVFIVIITINLQYFQIVAPQKAILFAGYIGFFFLQSLILSFRFASALKLAKIEAEQGLIAKNEFLSTMSHEIRTPLNSILGMTHIILRDNPRTEQKEQLNVLLFSANNLLAIVNDILDYNKIEAGKITFETIEWDLKNVVKNILSGLKNSADDKGIELRLDIDPALQTKIIGDPTRVGQVITNLVNNAIKFTKKGYVLLDVKVISQNDSTISLTIRVEDTGIGIAQEKQKVIFDQFTQADTTTSRNFGGTGLGLAICKKLLELQGSALKLMSEDGKGSIFYFTQTFAKAISAGKVLQPLINQMPSEESKPLSGISILLVEDNEINVLVAKTFLERWGANIDVAQNGQEALNLLDIHKHHLVLMDMHMPVMDGYEATKRMRINGVTLPIIALTASLPREVEDRVKELGVNDIIVKPFVPDDLFRIVLHYTGVFHSPN